MSYTTTSQLEREARSKGDPLIWQAFFRSYVDSDANVRNKCYSILTENPEGAKQFALEKLVEKGGVWIESNLEEIHVHGVRHQIGRDLQPHTLSWKLGYREGVHPERLTEAELPLILPEGDYYLPSVKQIDATLRAVQIARERQPREVQDYLGDLSNAISKVLHTSTRIERGMLIHGWGQPDAEQTELPRPPGTTAHVVSLMHCLDTSDTSEQIQQRYALLSRFEPTCVEFLLGDDSRIMIGGGRHTPVRYYTASFYHTQGVVRPVKTTPIIGDAAQ